VQDGKQSIISRSRRDFIRGRLGREPLHIASLLIQARPEGMAETEARLAIVPGVELHGSAGQGKLIVTVETESDAGLVAAIDRIQATAGVITVSLVYHQEDATEDDASDSAGGAA